MLRSAGILTSYLVFLFKKLFHPSVLLSVCLRVELQKLVDYILFQSLLPMNLKMKREFWSYEVILMQRLFLQSETIRKVDLLNEHVIRRSFNLEQVHKIRYQIFTRASRVQNLSFCIESCVILKSTCWLHDHLFARKKTDKWEWLFLKPSLILKYFMFLIIEIFVLNSNSLTFSLTTFIFASIFSIAFFVCSGSDIIGTSISSASSS